MLGALRQPRWMIATVVVVALAALFVRLGFWQLDRLDERQSVNEVGEQRIAAEAVDLANLMDQTEDPTSIQYRRVMVTGEFDISEEILIRSQVELGRAGFHVITPLVTDDGLGVLINRGWVPLPMDTPPVDVPLEPGSQTIEGWVHLTETRPPLGSESPPGDLDVFSRVDLDRISEQVPYEIAPVYVVAIGERGNDLPLPVEPPDFDDEGPHLSYAIQWFGFAAVALVGFFFLLRRKGGQ